MTIHRLFVLINKKQLTQRMSGLDKFNFINEQKLNQITYLLHQN
jgi:hypothetical protein